jgi:DNA ligase-associated metallophosphoesterase
MNVEIRNETFELLPERCLFRLKTKTLLAADLHWGKAEVFQKAGVSISSRVLSDDLARLTRAFEKTGAQKLVVLGDLIHAPKGVTEEVVNEVARWRESHADVEILLIRGNHDRQFVLPQSWRIESVEGTITETPFLLTHDDVIERNGLHQIAGHVHPVLTMRGAGDSLRLPCFAVGADSTLLPAFSAFTGGFEIRRNKWKQVFVVTDTSVIEV